MYCKVCWFYSALHHHTESVFLKELLIKTLENNHSMFPDVCLTAEPFHEHITGLGKKSFCSIKDSRTWCEKQKVNCVSDLMLTERIDFLFFVYFLKSAASLKCHQLVGTIKYKNQALFLHVINVVRQQFLSSLSSKVCFSSLRDMSTPELGCWSVSCGVCHHRAPTCPADSIKAGIYLSNWSPVGRNDLSCSFHMAVMTNLSTITAF